MGRGGNVNIDGQDNNDDVVGGPLLNLPIDAVQEFQIATSRYGADIGRSASSVINVVTRSGTNAMHGTAAIFARDDAWQALPPTLDNPDEAPPFDRQQISGALGGPLRRDRLFWFASGEYRDQDGGVLVGTRDPSTRTISRGFAPAPSRDRLWSLRVDSGGAANRYMARYAGEWAVDTAASSIERAIGSASQRQDGTNRYNSVLASWTSAPRANFVHSLSGSVSTFLNETLPVTTAPQLTFPSIQDGASFRMPQETRQRRLQVTDSATLVRGAHSFRFGGEVQRVDAEFRLGVFQQGRIEFIHDFATFDHNGDGVINDNDLLFSVTLRSGKPDQALILPDADNTHIAGFIQDDWAVSNRLQLNLGLRYEIDSEVNNQSRVDELNPIVLPFVTRRAAAGSEQLRAEGWLCLERDRARSRRSRRLRPVLRPHRAPDPVARARARRPRAPHRSACRQRVLPRSGVRAISALRSEYRESLQRLRATWCGRLGHQHHRPAPAEPLDS